MGALLLLVLLVGALVLPGVVLGRACDGELGGGSFFGIHVVDKKTGRGVPRVKLTTTTNEVYITDSGGWAAVLTPGYEGQPVWFAVESDGYSYPSNPLGGAGVALTVVGGKNKTIEVTRTQKAERLYRLTGAGVYRDSVLLGLNAPTARPLLNGGVQGQDTVFTVLFDGAIRWFWGDTGRLSFPLGNFETTGAISCAPSSTTTDDDPSSTAILSPPVDPDPCLAVEEGINLKYFTTQPDPAHPNGVFVKPMATLPPMPFPTWIGSLSVVPTSSGGSTMLAYFMKAGHEMNTLR